MELKKFEREYPIRSYECDKNGHLRLITLMNIFQDMADSHANIMGLGFDYCKAKGLAWVGSNYHIKIERMPQWHETIKIITWPCMEKKLGAVRDFMVIDEKGEVIVRAASQWVLINFEKKRPVGLRENLPHYKIIDDRAINADFEKIDDVNNIDKSTEFKVRFDDIDVNKHVNNAVYSLWASEAVIDEFRDKHTIKELEIAFKKEGYYGEKIMVLTEMKQDTSIHSIKALTDDRELAKVKIIWQFN